jgi:hypothetical protein
MAADPYLSIAVDEDRNSKEEFSFICVLMTVEHRELSQSVLYNCGYKRTHCATPNVMAGRALIRSGLALHTYDCYSYVNRRPSSQQTCRLYLISITTSVIVRKLSWLSIPKNE